MADTSSVLLGGVCCLHVRVVVPFWCLNAKNRVRGAGRGGGAGVRATAVTPTCDTWPVTRSPGRSPEPPQPAASAWLQAEPSPHTPLVYTEAACAKTKTGDTTQARPGRKQTQAHQLFVTTVGANQGRTDEAEACMSPCACTVQRDGQEHGHYDLPVERGV